MSDRIIEPRIALVVTRDTDRDTPTVLLVREDDDREWSVPVSSLPPGGSVLSAAWTAFALTGLSNVRPALLGIHEEIPEGGGPHALTFAVQYRAVGEQTPTDQTIPAGWDAAWVPLAEAAPTLRRDLGEAAAAPLFDDAAPRPFFTATAFRDDAPGDRGDARTTRVNVRVAVRDDAGRLLLTQGRKGAFYVAPGGHLERGETLRGCAAREVAEETGLHTAVGPLLALNDQYDGRKREIILEAVFYGTVAGVHPAVFVATDHDGYRREVRFASPDEVAALPAVFPALLRGWGRTLPDTLPDTYTANVR